MKREEKVGEMKVNLATGVRTEGARVWKSLLIPWAKERLSQSQDSE